VQTTIAGGGRPFRRGGRFRLEGQGRAGVRARDSRGAQCVDYRVRAFIGVRWLAEAAPAATFRLWRDTDELRAGLVPGRSRLITTPSHVPANLANRGLPMRLLAIISMGHLSIGS
jgi:hypothetical protein